MMHDKMINLFTNNCTSALYVAGYVQAMARRDGAGVSVWHGT